MTRKPALLAFFLVALVVAGCSTVNRSPQLDKPGAPAPTVLLQEKPIKSGLVIEQIDGKWRGIGWFKRFELMPGEHTLTVALNEPFWQGEKLYIRFEAKSGEHYHIYKDLSGNWWSTRVVEDSTGKIFEGVTKKALAEPKPAPEPKASR